MATPGTNAADTGRAAEDYALAMLQKAGLRLLERNFRCRFGEIDLIMREGSVLVFVEVRHRSSARFGSAAESVTPRKLQRLLAAARVYLGRHAEFGDCPMRFDLFGIDGASGKADPLIQWHREIITGEQEIFGDG